MSPSTVKYALCKRHRSLSVEFSGRRDHVNCLQRKLPHFTVILSFIFWDLKPIIIPPIENVYDCRSADVKSLCNGRQSPVNVLIVAETAVSRPVTIPMKSRTGFEFIV
jgi:hypothetical protein